jgi:hypothetical protein
MLTVLTRLGTAALLLVGLPSAHVPRTEHAKPFGGPEIIIFHGGVLTKPSAVATWDECQALLVNGNAGDKLTDETKLHLGTRPRIELALFWGNAWRDVAQNPARLAALKPSEANQRGVFYPAIAGSPAVIAVETTVSGLSDSGLAILRRHGIPITTLRPRR